jgi:hypothetical protein
VLKVEESRGEELKELGWPADQVRRYEELWEYRQRWGAINLEPEERAFLRKAEGALPKRLTGRAAQKKTIREKSHHRWLSFHLEAMKAAEPAMGLDEGEQGAWPIVLEEELRALEELQPVLGLPDTLRSKEFFPVRERLASEAAGLGRILQHDFEAALEELRAREKTSWKPLRPEPGDAAGSYPVLPAAEAEAFRARARAELLELTRLTYPSLREKEAAPVATEPAGSSEPPSETPQ